MTDFFNIFKQALKGDIPEVIESETDPKWIAYNYIVTKGGKGSGNFGHAGRPGEWGGSAPQGVNAFTKHYDIPDSMNRIIDGLAVMSYTDKTGKLSSPKSSGNFGMEGLSDFEIAAGVMGETNAIGKSIVAKYRMRFIREAEQAYREGITLSPSAKNAYEAEVRRAATVLAIARMSGTPDYEVSDWNDLLKSKEKSSNGQFSMEDTINKRVEEVKALFAQAQAVDFGSSAYDPSNKDDKHNNFEFGTKFLQAGAKIAKDAQAAGVQILTDNTILLESAYIKDTLVTDLAKRSGLEYGQVNDWVKSWAQSAQSPEAMQLHYAASKEFDFKIPSYIARKMKEYGTDREYGYSLNEAKKLVKAMYDSTQERLASMGYGPDDEIPLFRGVRRTQGALKKYPLTNDTYLYSGSPLESWTHSTYTAKQFAKGIKGVISMKVKRKNIFSTALTGIGCFNEGEVIVLGAKENYRASIGDL